MTRQGKLLLTGVAAVIFLIWAFGALVSSNQVHTSLNYSAVRICDDAFEQIYDFRNQAVDHFDVKLQEGCFGGFVYLPKVWHTWHTQPAGDQVGFWVSIWIAGEPAGRTPFFANSDVPNVSASAMRTQGHGTLRFYSNDVMPSTQTSSAPSGVSSDRIPEPSTQPLGKVQVLVNQDPHVCDKPDDAHYEGWHAAARPRFLFDVHNNDFSNSSTQINWGDGFKGIVPVCFIVDEQGNPVQIHLLHSLEKPELQKHIEEVVGGWRYQTGMWESQPVKTQMVVNFFFD